MIEYLMIGEVLKPQGIKGEVKIKPYAANHDDFRRWKTLYIKQGEGFQPIKMKCSRVHEGFVYAYLGECASMEDAEKYRAVQLYVDRAHANPLEEDEVYISDLIGCEGIDTNGRSIGKITDVMQPGGNDVYVFNGPLGEVLVPALKIVVLEVNVEEKRMLLDAQKLSEVAVFDED